MTYLRDLIHRLRLGQSQRQISRDLNLARETVHKYTLWAAGVGLLNPGVPFPDDATLQALLGTAPPPPRTPSRVGPYREVVGDLLGRGVEMTAILARLRESYGYQGSYSSLRRFVAQCWPSEPKVVARVHSAPGEEAQVDFGPIGDLYDPHRAQVRAAYVFVATLSYSRHQYAELVFDQKVSTWIVLHRRAFESWQGVPRRLVPDNLKAAVTRILVDEPVLGEAYRRMALHYGFIVSPTRPGTPQHKGKVESGVHYIQRNFIAGQQFADIEIANRRLQTWICEVAGTRQHGTTHQAPLRLFHDEEQVALLPLPEQPFTLCKVRIVRVHPDCHVTFDGSFYSVPWEYVPGGPKARGEGLTAHISEQIVQLFDGADLVATHLRTTTRGQWRTCLAHYPPDKAAYLERTPQRCRELAAQIGPATQQVIGALLDDRPLDRLRSVQALLRLVESVGPQRLEAACGRALYFGSVSYRHVKEILNAALDRQPLPETEPVTSTRRTFAFARAAGEFFPEAN